LGKQRKIEITIQTDRRVVICATGLGRTWCQQCGGEREFVTLQTAGQLADSIVLDVVNGSLPPNLHMALSPDGSHRVCLKSLMQLAARGSKLSGSIVVKGSLPEK
jgi:hypothetical protein